MMRYLFVINPISGNPHLAQTAEPRIREVFSGLPYQIVTAEEPGHASRVVSEAAEEAQRAGDKIRICACGGDGTINEVISGATGFPNAAVTAMPYGSGNDFLRSLGDPKDFLDPGMLLHGVTRKIDLLEVNGKICVNIFSVGLDAEAAAKASELRESRIFGGKNSYTWAVAGLLLKPLGQHFKIRINNEQLSDNYLIAAVGNGQVYGGGYRAAPEAKLDDGLADVILVRKISRFRIAGVIGKYKKGEHIADGRIVASLQDCARFIRTNRMTIESDRPICANLDGDTMWTDKIDLHVLPGAISFIVPE